MLPASLSLDDARSIAWKHAKRTGGRVELLVVFGDNQDLWTSIVTFGPFIGESGDVFTTEIKVAEEGSET